VTLSFDAARIRDRGGLREEVSIDAASFLGGGWGQARPAGELRLVLEFSVGRSSILLEARASGAWELACGRCLAPHRRDFSCSWEETYPLEAASIEVAADAREAVIVEIPQRSLCRPDCRGLCPGCGLDLNREACACPAGGLAPFGALKDLNRRKENDHAES
jgi:uncharacterized protein